MRTLAPVVEGTVTIDGVSLSLLGIDLFAEREIRSFTGETRSEDSDESNSQSLFVGFLTTPGVVMTSEQTATELGLSVSDAFELQANGRARPAELLAVFDDEGGLDRLLVTDIATAQEWLDKAGQLTRIDVRVEDDTALAALRAALPDGTQVLSATGRTRATADMSQAFMTNLTAMSLLALLVGLFLIFNSVNFSVLQRRALIGVLRALGLTRRQLLTMILVEAGLVGLVAAGLGVVFGIVNHFRSSRASSPVSARRSSPRSFRRSRRRPTRPGSRWRARRSNAVLAMPCPLSPSRASPRCSWPPCLCSSRATTSLPGSRPYSC
jgi:putative ABC transport system permease protein